MRSITQDKVSVQAARLILNELGFAEDVPSIQRAQRAVPIATADPVAIIEGKNGCHLVASANRNRVYTFYAPFDCSCPDARTHRPCKHAIAVAIRKALKTDWWWLERIFAEVELMDRKEEVDSFEEFMFIDEQNYKQSYLQGVNS